MSTAVAVIPTSLPAFLQTPEAIAAAERLNANLTGGISSGSFPSLTIGGGKFHIEDASAEPKKQLVTYQLPDGTPVPAMQLETVIVGGNPYVSKVWYKKKWVEGDSSEPDCSSDNSITPDAHIAQPQSTSCATCPMNEWGSSINETTGKQGKACQDSKRVVFLSIHNLDFKALALKIPAASMKEFANYVRTLEKPGISIPLDAVVTRIMFDPTVTYPKLKFTFVRMVTEEEYAKIKVRQESDEVKRIETPVRAARPVPQPPAPQPTVPAAAAPAPAPSAPAVPPPPPVIPVAPTPAPTAAAQPAPSQAAQLTIPSFPVAPAPVAEAPPEPAVEPHYPPHVVAAVQGAGGFQSEAGKLVLAALMPELAPKADKKPRAPRTPKAEAPATQVAPPSPLAPPVAAPLAVAPPASPAPSFASAPAAQVVQPASPQASSLSAALADILKK